MGWRHAAKDSYNPANGTDRCAGSDWLVAPGRGATWLAPNVTGTGLPTARHRLEEERFDSGVGGSATSER
jgi:hypothetical protein